jgi:hypothetical protein
MIPSWHAVLTLTLFPAACFPSSLHARPANQMEWVSARFDKIHFHFLMHVECASMGFVLIKINKILLYQYQIEYSQM